MNLYSDIFSTNPDNHWFKILFVVVLLFIVVHLFYKNKEVHEGFTQTGNFVAKYGEDIYDDFYVNIYDILNKTETRNVHEYQVFLATQPDKDNSRILDVGCATGCLVKKLKDEGYDAIGIDKSKSMVKAGLAKFGEDEGALTCGSAESPDLLECETVTHVLCTHFTIYSIEDKVAFFKNCNYWMVNGGYLILHLVDRLKFDLITPAGKPDEIKIGGEDGKRRKDTVIEFRDFIYKSTWDFSKMDKNNNAIQMETFTDRKTNKVRHNENTLFMEKESDILAKAQYCGFSMIAKYSLVDYNGDDNQSIYILTSIKNLAK